MPGSTRHAAHAWIRNHSSREAPPQTIELPADLVFSARLYDFERACAGTRGHVGGPPPPAAPKCRFASEPAVPLRSGWSGHCLQIVERVLTTLRLRKTQDKCQSLRDRGALAHVTAVAE